MDKGERKVDPQMESSVLEFHFVQLVGKLFFGLSFVILIKLSVIDLCCIFLTSNKTIYWLGLYYSF